MVTFNVRFDDPAHQVVKVNDHPSQPVASHFLRHNSNGTRTWSMMGTEAARHFLVVVHRALHPVASDVD